MSTEPLLDVAAQGEEISDSGTDTDDEGLLIKQATAELKRHKHDASSPPHHPPPPPPLHGSEPSSLKNQSLAKSQHSAPEMILVEPLPTPSSCDHTISNRDDEVANKTALTDPKGSEAVALVSSREVAGPAGGAGPGPSSSSAVRSRDYSRSAPRRPVGAITMKLLIDSGFLVPGLQVCYVEYKGNITWGDLSREGRINCDGLSFESPSAFSIYIKRLVNPTRKADDGWKAVKYAGKLLEHYKEEYLRQKYSMAATPETATMTTGNITTAETLDTAAAAEVGESLISVSRKRHRSPRKRRRLNTFEEVLSV